MIAPAIGGLGEIVRGAGIAANLVTVKCCGLHISCENTFRTDRSAWKQSARARVQFFRLRTDVGRACTGISASRGNAPRFISASKLTRFPRIRGSLKHCDPS